MKPVSSFVAMTFAILLAGCSVQIDASNAIARAASSGEIRNDAGASDGHPDGAGVWVLLSALIDREAVQRVARWEVYPHVHVVECSTGKDTNVGTEPRLEAIDFGNANAVSGLLKEHPAKETYRMQSLIFAREGDFKTPQCLQFQGGSYLGQKIIEKRIPIRTIGQLP